MKLQPVLEIGGTHVTAALVDLLGANVVASVRRPIDSDGDGAALLDAIASPACELISDGQSAPEVEKTWGVAIPGPFDYAGGIGDFTGIGKFWGLHGVDVGQGLVRRLPADARHMVFLNDADAFALGEWALSRPAPARAVYLTLGTGVGSCYLADGWPVKSGPGLPADGHVHRLRWNGQPLEEWVSRRALVRDYFLASGRELDVRQIAELARAGDGVAGGVLERAYKLLGEIVGPSVKAFGADRVVVGGSIARSWDLVEGPLAAGLAASRGSSKVVPEPHRASGLDEAPILGAAVAAGRAMAQDGAR
ncbi:MAG: ROK family protein [Bifidobacteriaceae bacterium]|jgi:glucokinase|nr:ROK family protein [Bifidobacteriaceae bacterium]